MIGRHASPFACTAFERAAHMYPFLSLGSLWGNCLCVSASSSHFTEVTAWV